MTTVEKTDKPKSAVKTAKNNIIRLPKGLLGFESATKYVLLGKPEEAPFLWFRMLEEPKLAFLVVSPLEVDPDYHPDISAEDAASLGLAGPEDGIIFNIVTLHSDSRATINLKGPIIVNRHTLIGKQVVPLNVGDYALQHPLAIAS